MNSTSLKTHDFKLLFESVPGLYLVLDPALHIIAASNAYLQATKTRRADIIEKHLFEIFPDNPDDPASDGVRNTRASLDRVLESHQPDVMVVLYPCGDVPPFSELLLKLIDSNPHMRKLSVRLFSGMPIFPSPSGISVK